MKTSDIIYYIQKQTKFTFPFRELFTNEYSLLAGGSVANAIYALKRGIDFPISDFDIFIKAKEEEIKKRNLDGIVTVKLEDESNYPEELSTKVSINSRESKGNIDFIYLAVTELNGKNKIQSEHDFYKTVLSSFDLNCTQAGIYFNPVTYDFEIITTPEFDRFLETDTIELTNIHSKVTYFRLLKKAQDLDAKCDLEKEIKIIGTACNPDNLKPLNIEQALKHEHLLDMEAIFDLAVKNKRDKGFELLFEYFAELDHYNKRQLKIKALRTYYDGTSLQKLNILRMFYRDPVLYIRLLYASPFGFIEDKEYLDKDIKELSNFLIHNPGLFNIFAGLDTLSEVIARHKKLAYLGSSLYISDVVNYEYPVQESDIEKLLVDTKVVYNTREIEGNPFEDNFVQILKSIRFIFDLD